MGCRLEARDVINVVGFGVESGSEHDSLLELLTPSGILLLKQVRQHLVLGLLLLVNLLVIRHDLNKADVLIVDLDAGRGGALELDLENKGVLPIVIRVLLLIVIRIFAGFSGGLACVFLMRFIFFAKVINELNLYKFFSLLMFEFYLFLDGQEVLIFGCLVIDFLHHVGFAVARNVTGGAVLSDELDVSELVHLSNLNAALVERDSAGKIFILDNDAGHGVIAIEALAIFIAYFDDKV